MREKRYILFDLDGTLTDPKEGITKSVQHALAHFGIAVDDLDSLIPFIGPPLTDSFEMFYGFTHEQALEGVRVYREYFTQRGWRENREYAGVREMLRALKTAGFSLSVATSKPEVFALRILDYFHLTDYFDVVGGADLDGTRIRKADVIRYTLGRAGVSQSGQALEQVAMVGDREHDILGAKAVGIESVGVLYGYGSREELEAAGADALAEQPVDLVRLLQYNLKE